MPSGGGGEIASEGIQTVVSLLSLYSDSVLSNGALGRFQVMKTGGSCSVRCFSGLCLEALRRIELLAEMLSERLFGGNGALKVLLMFEIIKAICKIYLCYRGKDVEQKGAKTGLARSSGFRVKRDFLHPKMLESAESLRWWLAGTIFHSLRPVIYLAVLLKSRGGANIDRRKSCWPPWLLSLILDLIAHFVAAKATELRSSGKSIFSDRPTMSHATQSTDKGSQSPPTETTAPDPTGRTASPKDESGIQDLSRTALFQDEEQEELKARIIEHNSLERAELSRRKGLLLLYLLRPPAMDAFLKPLVALLRRVVGRVPLVGSVANLLLDLLVSLEHYYSYSAGS
jgi:hypothetical protein